MGYGFGEGRSGGNFRGGGFRKPFNAPRAPVREGEELDVLIESVGEKGDGIAKIKGFVIFVPNTKANDSVRIRVTKVLSKVGFGEVIGKADVKPKSEENTDSMPKKARKSRKSDESVSDVKSDEPSSSETDLSTEFENEADAEEESEEF